MMLFTLALIGLVAVAVVAAPEALRETSADDMIAEVDARTVALTAAVDPERRAGALAEVLKPFQPGGVYAYVPTAQGIDPATKKFLADQDEQAAFKLFHLEDFTRKAEPIAAALADQQRRAPDAEACLLARSGQVGLSLSDSLSVHVLDELRQIRLAPIVQSSSASAQFAAYQTALLDPTDGYNSTLIRMMEAAHLHGFGGPRPESPEDLKAAQDLRKAIIATREGRISESTRTLLARLAEAKRHITKAKTLHQLHPANPSHPGAGRER